MQTRDLNSSMSTIAHVEVLEAKMGNLLCTKYSLLLPSTCNETVGAPPHSLRSLLRPDVIAYSFFNKFAGFYGQYLGVHLADRMTHRFEILVVCPARPQAVPVPLNLVLSHVFSYHCWSPCSHRSRGQPPPSTAGGRTRGRAPLRIIVMAAPGRCPGAAACCRRLPVSPPGPAPAQTSARLPPCSSSSTHSSSG